MSFTNHEIISYLWPKYLQQIYTAQLSTTKSKLFSIQFGISYEYQECQKSKHWTQNHQYKEFHSKSVNVITKFLAWTRPLYINSLLILDFFRFLRFYAFRTDSLYSLFYSLKVFVRFNRTIHSRVHSILTIILDLNINIDLDYVIVSKFSGFVSGLQTKFHLPNHIGNHISYKFSWII